MKHDLATFNINGEIYVQARAAYQVIEAERERCARIVEADGMHLTGDQEDEREADVAVMVAKIRNPAQ